MMRNFLVICTLLVMTSCGLNLKNEEHIQHSKGGKMHQSSDAVFSSYIKNYETHAKEELSNESYTLKDIPINFGDTKNENFDGVCFSYSNGDKEIIIKKSWWDGAEENQKQILILHELGHCDLGREHDNEMIAVKGKSISASIMFETIPSSSTFINFKQEYIKELFKYDKDGIYSKAATINAEIKEEATSASPSLASN